MVTSRHVPETGLYLTAVVSTAFVLARQREITQVIETHTGIIRRHQDLQIYTTEQLQRHSKLQHQAKCHAQLMLTCNFSLPNSTPFSLCGQHQHFSQYHAIKY